MPVPASGFDLTRRLWPAAMLGRGAAEPRRGHTGGEGPKDPPLMSALCGRSRPTLPADRRGGRLGDRALALVVADPGFVAQVADLVMTDLGVLGRFLVSRGGLRDGGLARGRCRRCRRRGRLHGVIDLLGLPCPGRISAGLLLVAIHRGSGSRRRSARSRWFGCRARRDGSRGGWCRCRSVAHMVAMITDIAVRTSTGPHRTCRPGRVGRRLG